MTVNEMFSNSNEKSIKTHLTCTCSFRGIEGFFDAEELRKYYGECSCSIEEYEKDYGDGVSIRSFLLIDTDKSYTKEIMVERAMKKLC